ncbi:arylsulfatase B [Harpegnathos saltator]|uniref:Arylsulfatase B n=1 Tax=Harpegnathos saltator TaxID=610380 RepID=E2B337_HARSA|nr:arylsulfatase B [Harpegnathos saltator]EFN89886.1 Arylsulfatase B [Harpegnathos saltator]
MNSRYAWIVLVLLFIFVCDVILKNISRNSQATSKQPPNIVVIMADDLGWNDVSFNGGDEIPTPNIDSLAYNGVILNRHYVLPICTPSRTAFFTGQYPIRSGMQGYPLQGAEPRSIPLNNILLPQYLRKLGYATHLVGKWHVGYQTNNHTPTNRGFDTFLGYYSGYIEYFSHNLVENGQSGYDIHRSVGDNHTIEYRYDYMTDLITDEAENIISSHNPAKPLYLQLAHLAPHASTVDDVIEVRSWKATNDTLGYIRDINRRKFASAVVTMDESIGRVVDALRRADMLKNSIIVFMSDNGAPTKDQILYNFGSNYPLRGMKQSFFEGAVRGVACIYSPLIDFPSRVSTQLFHITDWLPTLYAAAGGDASDLKALDGIDQWSMIKNADNGRRQFLLVNINEKTDSKAALIGRYKLIRDQSEYTKYYGSTGKDPSYCEYNVTNVLASPVASAIADISRSSLDIDKIKQLREKSRVVCRVSRFSRCTKRTCLFDIKKDPCETTNVSSKYPKILKKLNALIDSYQSILVNQTNKPVDPAGFPCNFNDTWMPWLPMDYLPAKSA